MLEVLIDAWMGLFWIAALLFCIAFPLFVVCAGDGYYIEHFCNAGAVGQFIGWWLSLLMGLGLCLLLVSVLIVPPLAVGWVVNWLVEQRGAW